jgi:hypothetical protein
MGFHCRRLRTSGSAWTARVGGQVFGLSGKAGISGNCRGGSRSFEYAAPSDNVVPARAKFLLFRSWLSRLRRRQARGKTIPSTAFP